MEFQRDINNNDLTQSGQQMGETIAKGLGVGLEAGSYSAITAMENVYVELETLTKNAAKNAEKLTKKQQERQLANLKNALKLEFICEQEYYEKLKIFRDENLRQGTDAWYKCTEEIAAYNKRLCDEVEKQYEKIVKMRDALADDLKDNEPWAKSERVRFVGQGMNGTDLVYDSTTLKDFREEINLLELYGKRLKELKEIGDVPGGIFDDISKLSVKDGLAAANLILYSDREARQKFFEGYQNRNELAQTTAGSLMELMDGGTDYTKLTAGQDSEFVKVLSESFDSIPQSYYELGESAGGAFGEGFLGRLPEIMETARNTFAEFINQIAMELSAKLRSTYEGSAAVVKNTYQSNYTFNSSRDTTTQQLNAARNAATLARLRGGKN